MLQDRLPLKMTPNSLIHLILHENSPIHHNFGLLAGHPRWSKKLLTYIKLLSATQSNIETSEHLCMLNTGKTFFAKGTIMSTAVWRTWFEGLSHIAPLPSPVTTPVATQLTRTPRGAALIASALHMPTTALCAIEKSPPSRNGVNAATDDNSRMHPCLQWCPDLRTCI